MLRISLAAAALVAVVPVNAHAVAEPVWVALANDVTNASGTDGYGYIGGCVTENVWYDPLTGQSWIGAGEIAIVATRDRDLAPNAPITNAW